MCIGAGDANVNGGGRGLGGFCERRGCGQVVTGGTANDAGDRQGQNKTTSAADHGTSSSGAIAVNGGFPVREIVGCR